MNQARWTRQAMFYTGAICMYFGYGGILSVLAKESIDFYVVQLCIRYMCMVPLLIAGTPDYIRKGLVSKLPEGQKLLWSEKFGLFAALVFLLSLSVMLLPAVYNKLLSMVLLRFLIHSLLFVDGRTEN